MNTMEHTIEKSPYVMIEGEIYRSSVMDALQNDDALKALFKKRGELFSIPILPKVIQVSPTEFKCAYDDEYNKICAQIEEQINIRKEQILRFYKIRLTSSVFTDSSKLTKK